MKVYPDLLLRLFWIVLVSVFCLGTGFFLAVLFTVPAMGSSGDIPSGELFNVTAALLLTLLPVAAFVFLWDEWLLNYPQQKRGHWMLWFYHCALLVFMPAVIIFDLLHP